jgi:hypothetical protein
MKHPALALTTLASLLLSASAVHAHFEKRNDRNGGHWDDGGFYHCHEPQCIPTRNRNDMRLLNNRLSNVNEDIYFLEEDWPHWLELSGCKTARTVVLESTSRIPVTWTNPRNCEIREGQWIDAYTGEEYTRAGQLEVDHLIPPVYANAANGWQWNNQKRAQFANDPLNLAPVSRATHNKKGDRSIGRWRPDEAFLCEYAQGWRDVAEKYELDLFAQDRSRINTILKDCVVGESEAVEPQ